MINCATVMIDCQATYSRGTYVILLLSSLLTMTDMLTMQISENRCRGGLAVCYLLLLRTFTLVKRINKGDTLYYSEVDSIKMTLKLHCCYT